MVLHRPVELAAQTGQVELSQKQMSGNATNQASGIESLNTSALLAIYPSECYATTNLLEADFWVVKGSRSGLCV
jgi:hypothetical protein